jgi:hypothetical protein
LAVAVFHRVDDEWHHVAVTWAFDTGETQLFFDGMPHKPFWTSSGGQLEVKDPEKGGSANHMASQTLRSDKGARSGGCDSLHPAPL